MDIQTLFSTIVELIEFVLASLVISLALLIVLAIVVSVMPKDNPLRQLLVAFMKPLGVMAGAEVIALPLDLFPPIEAAYDVIAVLLVVGMWIRFFMEARAIWRESSGRSAAIGRDAWDESFRVSAATQGRVHLSPQTGAAYAKPIRSLPHGKVTD